ncbi:MAG: N-acetylneuraminate synthase family protein [Spirochaetales bacterium]|jgi:N-acetylneuraminate synthase|nr:N-acetylneuraminate synthase family protein [Spirochaetales bacterium]
MKIGGKTGRGIFIVAELGTAHQGRLDEAARLIEGAARGGADCAKFQWVIAREILHPLTGTVKLPGGEISLFRRFQELEQPPEFYARLKELTEAAGLAFLCSPFGLESLAGLKALGVSGVKIASPELNHLPLLEAARDLPPVILSTGVSTWEDIGRAAAIVAPRPPEEPDRAILLHCVTAYPAPEADYNLKVIPRLREGFHLAAGVSDHSLDPLLVPVLSLSQGAVLVEKHFTLSRSGGGLDDPIALDPEDFRRMCRALREAEKESPSEIIREMEARFGAPRIRGILGTGEKVLAKSEAANYLSTRRSLHALRRLPRGVRLTEKNTALLRTEKNLRVGLDPADRPRALGRRTCRTVDSGQGILWEDLEEAEASPIPGIPPAGPGPQSPG